jgi:hypothetical protein
MAALGSVWIAARRSAGAGGRGRGPRARPVSGPFRFDIAASANGHRGPGLEGYL